MARPLVKGFRTLLKGGVAVAAEGTRSAARCRLAIKAIASGTRRLSIEWHMRECLKPMLFDDDDPAGAARGGDDGSALAQSSPAAVRKRSSKLTANGGPVHSFHSLLRDLATCSINAVTTNLNQAYSFTLAATPTPIQAQANTLLDVDPTKL